MSRKPPDWQMPAGVSPGLWDYLDSPELAAGYDAYLAGAAVTVLDESVVTDLAEPEMVVADLGCGTGRTLVRLAELGVRQVVGVDLSPHMLKLAAEKTQPFRTQVSLVRDNLVTLAAFGSERFDLILCLFSTLGLVHPSSARSHAVQRFAALLKPGGRLVLHGHNRWANLWLPSTRTWAVREALRCLLFKAEGGNFPMPGHQGIGTLEMHLFTRGELVRLLSASGLRTEVVHSVGDRADGKLSWSRWLPGLRARGFIAVGHKDS